ncbi:MAG: right-handed parallel beta-helix repeat-containing protein [Thermoplasmata archaeon]|nr:right-handed parallel beta-helix repeat-containing protein [Thermoplasmata archaeon]
MMAAAIAIVLGLIVLSVAVGTAAGDTLHVDAIEGSDETGDGSAGNPYASITAGVGNATDGDTVLVAPGTYSENMIEITRPMSVVSESGDPADTIVGAVGYSQFQVHADNVTLSGFTIRYGTYTVYLDEADHCTISNNVITQGYVGLLMDGTLEDPALDNTISGNTVTANTGEGMWITSETARTLIEDNNVTDNGDIGIHIYYAGRQTVRGNTVAGNVVGITVHQTPDCLLDGNAIGPNDAQGLVISYSTDLTMTDNEMSGNLYNLEVTSGNIADFEHDIDTSNTVDGRPVHYWVGAIGGTVPSGAGMVGLVRCADVIVRDLSLSHNGASVLLVDTNGALVENVSATESRFGIRLYRSSNCTITGCYLTQNGDSALAGGIDVEESSFIEIVGNNCTDQIYGWSTGIHVQHSRNVTVEGNVADDNGGHGIVTYDVAYSRIADNVARDNLWGSGFYFNSGTDWCVVEGNNASRNGQYGFMVYGSYNSVIRRNAACWNRGSAGFGAHYCGHNAFEENVAMRNGRGFDLNTAGYNEIARNSVARNEACGIVLLSSDGNEVRNNSIERNGCGVELTASSDWNVIDGNDGSWSEHSGIRLDYDNKENVVSNNTLRNNAGEGILLNDANIDNVIAHNIVCNNSGTGIRIESDGYTPVPSSNNTVHDNLLENGDNAYDEFWNLWNIGRTAGGNVIGGPYLGGNYWSDYVGYDSDADGIGEEPHPIPGGDNADALPLMYRRPLAADFTWEPAVVIDGDNVSFHDRSSSGNASIVNWTWDLPFAGYPITPIMVYFQDPIWRFEAGSYDITLTVRDALGYEASATKVLVVQSPADPVADFVWSPAKPEDGEDVFFQDASVEGTFAIVNWTWDLPFAGYPITPAMRYLQDPQWRFAPGRYDITLTVTDAFGLNDSVTRSVAVTGYSLVGPFIFQSPSEKGTVGISAQVVGSVAFDCAFLASPPLPNDRLFGVYFDVTTEGNGTIGWVNVTWHIANLSASANGTVLCMYVWDPGLETWIEVEESGFVPGEDLLWANLTHLTILAPGTVAPSPPGPDGGDGEGGESNAVLAGVAVVLGAVIVALTFILLRGRRRGRTPTQRRGDRWDDVERRHPRRTTKRRPPSVGGDRSRPE